MQTMKELDTQNLPGVEVKEVTPEAPVTQQEPVKDEVLGNAQTQEVAESLVTRVSKVKSEEPPKHVDNPFG